ncbi:hypothetical protein D3C87_1565020 [compost metagenome]
MVTLITACRIGCESSDCWAATAVVVKKKRLKTLLRISVFMHKCLTEVTAQCLEKIVDLIEYMFLKVGYDRGAASLCEIAYIYMLRFRYFMPKEYL